MSRDVAKLASRWVHMFGVHPVTIRYVTEIAADVDRELLGALDDVMPSFGDYPRPERLQAWLRLNEDAPIVVLDEQTVYRFRRGTKRGTWQLALAA